MQLDKRFQLADQLRVAAQRELGLDALLDGGQVKLLKPGDLALRKRLVRELGERRAAPQRERLAQQLQRPLRGPLDERPAALPQQTLEALHVKLAGTDAHQIATATRNHDADGAVYPLYLERAAQPRDVYLQALRSSGRGLLAPQLLDQTVARHDLVRVQQQDRQQRQLLAGRNYRLTPVV